MKTKKLTLIIILLAVTFVAHIAATFLFCYETTPAVKSGEIPFEIVYEYKGEQKTLSGVLKCEYYGSVTYLGMHERYWEQDYVIDNPIYPDYPLMIDKNDELQTSLSIQPDMMGDYFMGDPLCADYYEGATEPTFDYYDYKNDIIKESITKDDEILETIGFKLISATYGEPIENSFAFSGAHYEADNITIFLIIDLLFLLSCVIFVRRDKEYTYNKLDKASFIINFPLGIIVLPFITLVCFLFGLVESSTELVNQIVYNIPSVFIIGLALSIALRRKGFSKTGFFIQFAGIALFLPILFIA